MKQSEFGLFGLGVMGQSLSLNLANKGVRLSVYNRSDGAEATIVSDFLDSHTPKEPIKGYTNLKEFTDSLERPRRIFLMIKAGAPVDMVMDDLIPLLETDDGIIDGGNSFFEDTQRRTKQLEQHGIHFIGCGVSGGEEGALLGPSMMPGGSKKGYQLVGHFLETIAAKDKKDQPCCTYIGPDGAGHFVKMVHNGIEYAEMQLLAELYALLRNNHSNEAISKLFSDWNDGPLSSYLLEITSHILKRKEGEQHLLNLILDKAGNKGTGSWSSQLAMQLGTATTMMTSAVFARYLSSFKEKRIELAAKLGSTQESSPKTDLNQLKEAYNFAKIINHHQGFQLIKAASITFEWNLDLSEIARVWTNGCIIKSDFMERCTNYLTEGELISNDSLFQTLKTSEVSVRETLSIALESRTAMDTFHAAYNYWVSMTSNELPANLIQAQRDYFGAHTYQRNDKAPTESFHTDWLEQ